MNKIRFLSCTKELFICARYDGHKEFYLCVAARSAFGDVSRYVSTTIP
jgi:hypothetical protein